MTGTPVTPDSALRDIDALATELEEAAKESRTNAEELEARAQALRQALATLTPAGEKIPFHTTVSDTAREQLTLDGETKGWQER